jgi:TP901 family phage tail tape measure protein
MPENVIDLTLRFKAQGADQVRKIKGTIGDVRKEVQQLKSTLSGQNLPFLFALENKLNQINASASAVGKSLTRVTGTSGRKGKGLFTVESPGEELGEIKRKEAIQARLMKNQALMQRQKEKEARDTRNMALGAGRAQLATIGFTGINLAQQMSGLLDNINFSSVLSPFTSKFGEIFGSLLGDTFSSVFGNLGKAIGQLAESILNVITTVFRTGLKAVGSLLTNLFISVITVGISGGLGLLIGVFAGSVGAILAIFQGMIESIFEIFKGLFAVLTSLISAGFELIKGVFSIFSNIVTGIWKGFWEGIKSIAEFTMNIINKTVEMGLDQLSKGFMDLVESERLAAKAFIQIADTAENAGKTFAEGTEQVRQQAQQLRLDFAVSQADALNASYIALSGGFREGAQALQVVNAAGKLAVIGQDSLKNTVDGLITVLQAYGKGSDEAESAAADLFAAVNLGKIELADLNSTLGNVVTSAAALKIPLKDLGGAVGFISLKGLSASKATVGLNRIFESLLNPTKANAQAFEEAGINLGELTSGAIPFIDIMAKLSKAIPEDQLREAFGTVQGRRAFRAIAQDVEGFRKHLVTGTKIAGNFGKSFEDMKGTLSFLLGKLGQIGQTIRENLVKPFAEVLRPIIKLIVNDIEKIGTSIRNVFTDKGFIKSFQDFLKPLAVSILGPVLGIMDTLKSGLAGGNLKDIFKNETLIKARDTVIEMIEFIKKIPMFLEQAFGIFTKIRDMSVYVFDSVIMPTLKFLSDPSTYETFFKFIKVGAEGIALMGTLFKDAFSNPKLFKDNFDIVFKFLYDSVKNLGSFMVDVLSSAFKIASEFFMLTIGEDLKDAISDFVGGFSETLGGLFRGKARSIEVERNKMNGGAEFFYMQPIQKAFEGMARIMQNGNDMIQKGLGFREEHEPNLEEFTNSVKESFEKLKSSMTGTTSEFGKNMLDKNPQTIGETLDKINEIMTKNSGVTIDNTRALEALNNAMRPVVTTAEKDLSKQTYFERGMAGGLGKQAQATFNQGNNLGWWSREGRLRAMGEEAPGMGMVNMTKSDIPAMNEIQVETKDIQEEQSDTLKKIYTNIIELKDISKDQLDVIRSRLNNALTASGLSTAPITIKAGGQNVWEEN